MTAALVIFFISVLVIFYAYVGYPLLVFLLGRLSPHPVAAQDMSSLPSVSVLLAVHNQADVITRKLANLLSLEYPPGKLDIVVVSDGSTDATNAKLSNFRDARLRVLEISQRGGKANALNQGLRIISSEIVFFTDARQMIEPKALKALVSNFSDPAVGCASGELILSDAQGTVGALGFYWRLEKLVRRLESASGSVVGVTGAIYAARRDLLPELRPGTILDDVLIPMFVSKMGYRVVFEPRARAWDALAADPDREFRRKVRTLTGNYQLLVLAPWILSPVHPVFWRFVSHKLLRLAAPFALAAALVSNLFLSGSFRIILALQICFYVLGLIGWIPIRLGLLGRVTHPIRAFLILNAAAVAAFFNFLKGRWAVWV